MTPFLYHFLSWVHYTWNCRLLCINNPVRNWCELEINQNVALIDKCTGQRSACSSVKSKQKFEIEVLQVSNINQQGEPSERKMAVRLNPSGDFKSKSGRSESSILRDFSPDLGFHDDINSPTGSITDFQDEAEKIEGSRF